MCVCVCVYTCPFSWSPSCAEHFPGQGSKSHTITQRGWRPPECVSIETPCGGEARELPRGCQHAGLSKKSGSHLSSCWSERTVGRCPSRTCDSSRVPLRGPTSGLRRLPEWPGQPSPERGNAGVQKGLLAEMGAVGARGGAKEGRQEWEEVGSGAPGRGARRGAGTGVRVSQRSSRTSGWQPALPGHVPCLPMGTLHPAPGLAGRPPLRCTHSTGVSHTLCPNQGTQQLPEQEPRADLHRCCPASPAPLVGSELTALVCSRHPSVLLSLSHPPDLQGRA